MSKNRWNLVLTYRTKNGPIDVEYDIEELEQVHNLVERGPDWNALIEGRFTLNRRLEADDFTVEKAAIQ